MICESCGKKITNDNESVCPYCNATLNRKYQAQNSAVDVEAVFVSSELTDKQHGSSDKVITPEVVGSENYNSSHFQCNGRHNGQGKQNYRRVTYTTQSGHGVNNLFFENGCFSALITLILAISCVIQFGILAGIGFLVFSGIGSILAFLLRVKSIMNNRIFNPWFARVISWAGAYMLIIWLSE